MKINSEIRIYCCLNENHRTYGDSEIDNEKDIVCKYCYDELVRRLEEANRKIEILESDIVDYTQTIENLENFKDEVIRSPDCPKSISSRIVAEKL